jgi:hypothetical protein
MGTTVEDLKEWYAQAKKEKATYMIVVCDTFDHEDYPVYVKKGEDIHERVANYNGPNMQRIMEVYCMKKPFDKQKMNGRLCWDLG